MSIDELERNVNAAQAAYDYSVAWKQAANRTYQQARDALMEARQALREAVPGMTRTNELVASVRAARLALLDAEANAARCRELYDAVWAEAVHDDAAYNAAVEAERAAETELEDAREALLEEASKP